MQTDEKHLFHKDAATFLEELGHKTAPQTLARHAHEGSGPEYLKAKNGRAIYTPRALRAWVDEQFGPAARSAIEHRRNAEHDAS